MGSLQPPWDKYELFLKVLTYLDFFFAQKCQYVLLCQVIGCQISNNNNSLESLS